MKVSKYNFIFEVDNNCFIYNSVSDSFAKITRKVRDYLNKNEITNIEELGLKTLINGRFIIQNDSTDEYELLVNEYRESINKNVYFLTLLPTLDCNVHCWYCFEKRIDGSRLHKIIQEAILKHVEHVLLTQPKCDRFIVELFGGEPLLYFEHELYPLLIKIKELLENNDKKVSFVFITNGLCLNKTNIQLLKTLKANFQVSIDGYKRKHDTIKKLKGHEEESSYDLVMKNIALLALNMDTHINLRINYDDATLKHTIEVIDSIKDIPRNKISIHFERVWQTAKNEMASNQMFKETIEAFLSNGFCVTYLNLFRKGYSCKASLINHMVISYNGDIYKCTGRDFTPELREGILKTDGTIKWEQEKKQRRMSIETYDNDTCKHCKLLPLCYGPCCQKQIESFENGKTIGDMCQLRKLEIPLKDYLMYRLKSELNRIS